MKTVGQLILELQALDPLLPVLVSCDEEGNCFSRYAETTEQYVSPAELGSYNIESVYSQSDIVDDFEEDPEDYTKVAVLWP